VTDVNRKGVGLEPLLHEASRRAGTQNVLEIVGLGAACALARTCIDGASVCQLRDVLGKAAKGVWQASRARWALGTPATVSDGVSSFAKMGSGYFTDQMRRRSRATASPRGASGRQSEADL